jgi:ribose transport system permease protein
VPLFIMSAGLTLVVLTAGIVSFGGAVLGLAACLGGLPDRRRTCRASASRGAGCGLACGIVNGLLVSYARIPSFIATYGMLWIANGMATVHAGRRSFTAAGEFRAIGTAWLGPNPVRSVMLGVLVILHVIMHPQRRSASA